MTQIREAKQVSVSETSETLYCIHCERMVRVEQGANGLYHQKIEGGWDGEVIDCTFPDGLAYSAPTELPDDWASQEPDDDQKAELEQEETGFWAEVWK